jgi:hypothetical protein
MCHGSLTDGNSELLTVIAFMRRSPGKREELKAALEALIEPTKGVELRVTDAVHCGQGGGTPYPRGVTDGAECLRYPQCSGLQRSLDTCGGLMTQNRPTPRHDIGREFRGAGRISRGARHVAKGRYDRALALFSRPETKPT